MQDFKLKQDANHLWSVLRAGARWGWIMKGSDDVYRACRHADGHITHHATFHAALLDLTQ